MCFSPQVHAIFRHQNFNKLSNADVFCTFSLQNMLFATVACNFSTSELQKVLPDPQFLNILTSRMRFSPQRRAIFQHQNFKKCFAADVFCTFSLPNVLLATAACNFWTSELQKVVPDPQFFQHFDFKICFSPQRCNFSTSELQKVLRACVFCTF